MTAERDIVMKAVFSYLLIFVLFLSLFCCAQEKTPESKILCGINDYNLTVDEFQYQLAAELELDNDFKLTEEAKREFLEELIKKELLIQEARRLKLDSKDKFIRAIERYWESTLIRDLMDLKGKEISKKILVSQKEIEARYNEMKESGDELPPFEEIEHDISKELKEKKKTMIFRKWLSDLRKNAGIEIDQDLLYKN